MKIRVFFGYFIMLFFLNNAYSSDLHELIHDFEIRLAQFSYQDLPFQVTDLSFDTVRQDVQQLCRAGKGGEGKIFIKKEIGGLCYKNWHSKNNNYHSSLVLVYMQQMINLFPSFSEFISIPNTYVIGEDWIVRDYYRAGVKMSRALDEYAEAGAQYRELLNELRFQLNEQGICPDSPKKGLSEEGRFLITLYSRLMCQTDNILWVPELNQFVWIDIF